MRTPRVFEQITGGIASPDTINQWLSALVPCGANGEDLFTRPSAAWLAAIQTVLRGSSALRHMQIDAIHHTQKRASQLANSLARSTGPVDAGKAWQLFSQDSLQNSWEYWIAYRAIVQHTEITMLNQPEIPISRNTRDVDTPARLMTPARRSNTIKSRAHRRISSAH